MKKNNMTIFVRALVPNALYAGKLDGQKSEITGYTRMEVIRLLLALNETFKPTDDHDCHLSPDDGCDHPSHPNV